jgi:hypothetical protein
MRGAPAPAPASLGGLGSAGAQVVKTQAAAWNPKVTYRPHPDEGAWRIQNSFVFELSHSAPAVLEAIRAEVLPLWRAAAACVRDRAHRWAASYSGQDSNFAGLDDAYEASISVSGFQDEPPCAAAVEALELVLSRFNLLTPWIFAAAKETLTHSLMTEDPETVDRLKLDRSIETALHWSTPPLVSHGQEPPMPPLGVEEWRLEDLPLAIYRARFLKRRTPNELRSTVEGYLAAVQVWARRLGFVPDAEFRERGGKGLRDRLRWVVQHRCHGEKFLAIASAEHLKQEASVREAVRKLEERLGLPRSRA